jgi:putative NIF3 family GTP cyclohydrolase 1 type 2
MTQLSRREFAALAAGAAVAPLAVGQTPARAASITVSMAGSLTAQELIDRIKAQIGVAWKAETVDGVKAGEPTTVVTGVVTTALASLSVLQRAVNAGANVVIASQPVFYARADARTPPARRGPGGPGSGPGGAPPAAAATAPAAEPPPADPVFTAKNAFIDRHKLVVIRLSDHWRLREPDPLAQGFGAAMGWAPHQVAGNPRRYDVPALTVDALVGALGKALGASGGLRVVGDPKTSVRRIGVLPGSTPIQASLDLLPGVDAIVGGEVREWESVEYARDVVAAGGKKALILVGRIVSEEPGMRVCADWLKTVTPGLPVRHIAAGDPYWRP